MKIQYILILFAFISCGQNTKEKKEPVVKAQDAVEVGTDVPKEDSLSFKDVINNTKTRPVPLTEATNFDSFIEEGDYNKVEEQTLKLIEIYPNFYKEGYNYKAISSYKVELSKDYHSIIVTILKGDQEMVSVLINYDLNGDIIDSKVISHDEIPEGIFKIESKIEKNKITVNYTEWTDEKHQVTDIYEVKANGKITYISEEDVMIDDVINQLGLSKQNIKTDLITYVMFGDTRESIVVIPEIVEEGEQYFELNSHIVIFDNITNQITHKYFESSKTNGWDSDAIKLSEITIDTAPYIVTEGTRAFGVVVHYFGSSQVNPYSNKNISLFIESGNVLRKVLNNYDVMDYKGRWDTDCIGESTDVKNTLIMSKEKTYGYFNIIVKSKITQTTNFEDENGDCDDKEKITAETRVLKFNGEEYKEKEVPLTIDALKKEGSSSLVNSKDNLSLQELMLLTKLKAIKKYGAPSSRSQFILDDAQGEFRNGISDKYTQKERQSESILIEEITWEKDENTWITVWYELKHEKTAPKSVYLWKKGTEF